MPVFMPHWPKPLGKRPIEIDLKLERVLAVLKALDNPQNKAPPVIHVAGTNGKGSTIAFMRAILENSGYKTHIYTSPHLLHFNERIVIAGKQIEDDYLFQILEECRIATGENKLTFFEGTTIAAILAFAYNDADFCLIETGMGGRLDATNVFTNTLLSIITSISFDHTEYLGNTLAKIATEKAGILKPGVSVIISEQNEEARCAIEKVAIEKKSPVFRSGFEWHVDNSNDHLIFSTGGEDEKFRLPNLLGGHQILNAGNAIAAVTLLKNKFEYDKITHGSVSLGVQNAQWPARLEKITNENKLAAILPDGWQLFLDGAHNSGGAQTLSKWLKKERCYFILGMTRDKDTIGFLREIQDNIKGLFCTCVQSEPRSQTTEEMVKTMISTGLKPRAATSILEAIEEILGLERLPHKIIICGSLFLAKDVENYR